MDIDKEAAARKAAAKFSTDLNLATIEYAKMLGRLCFATSHQILPQCDITI